MGYVKRNAIAGGPFPRWGAVVAHLERWNRKIADQRVHGTTGEPPIARFAEKAGALRPLGGRAPFSQLQDLVHKVRPNCAIDLDTGSSKSRIPDPPGAGGHSTSRRNIRTNMLPMRERKAL